MKHIKGYDTLRAFSIILVLLSHLGLFYILPEDNFIRQRVWPLISGTTGVQIFFTLSGFLITKILLQEFNNFQSINFKNFYIRRFLRLLPPLIVYHIAIAILMKLQIIKSTSYGFLFSFFYLYNFLPNKYYSGELGHTWSLALEEQYYLIWPFIINYLKRLKVFIFMSLIILACIIVVYLYPHWSFAKEYRIERWFIPAVAPIIIGSFCALLINNKDTIYNTYFNKKNAPFLIGILLFINPLYTPALELSFIFQSVGVSMILLWILYNQDSTLTALLNNKVLSYIGKISYGIYVYQGLFLKTGPSGDIWIQKFPQNIILTFVAAILSFHFLESPILKLKKKFSRTNPKI